MNKNVEYLLCAIYVFTTYAWVEPLKDKKGKTVNIFIKIVNHINYGLIKKEKFTINVCKNG